MAVLLWILRLLQLFDGKADRQRAKRIFVPVGLGHVSVSDWESEDQCRGQNLPLLGVTLYPYGSEYLPLLGVKLYPYWE